MNIYQGQLDEYLKEKEQVKRSSVDGKTMDTSKRDHSNDRDHNTRNGHSRHHHRSNKVHHHSHRRAEEKRFDERPFPHRNEKAAATVFPQQVPWPNSNEARQESLNLGLKGAVLMEDKGFKDPTLVSSSRVQAGGGVPPMEIEAPDSSTRSDGRTQGATNWSIQGHHNGGRVSGVTNSSRREHRMNERVPGAVVVPGFDEEVISRHDDDQSYSDDSQDSDGRRNESNESSPHAITAQVVDPEEEHRVLREQLHQVLREERAHATMAVIHPASIGRGVEYGTSAVGHAAANDSDDDVEHGNMTVGQAPVININANVEQTPSMNVDPLKTGGFWHGTRGRLVIAALILVIVAAAVGVTLALVLYKETPTELESITVSTPPPTLEQTPEITSTPPPTLEQTPEITSTPATLEPTTMEPTIQPTPTQPTPESTPVPTMPDNTSPPTPTPTPEQRPESTSMPTPPVSPVDNGICSSAWDNPVDGKIYAGSNENGGYVSACLERYSDNYGPAAWYRFTGTGRPTKVSTCNKNTTDFYTVLSVVSSTDGTCNKTDCVTSASGAFVPYYSQCPAEVGSTGSTVSVPTDLGSVYYASVIGAGGLVGKFGLTIFDDSVGCEDDKEEHPVDGKLYAGSNENGKYVSACLDRYSDNFGPGAWYRFIGNGELIKASTCNKNTTEFYTVLSVFSSDGTCNKLVCEMSASGAFVPYYSQCPADVGSTGSTVSVLTDLGSVYFVSVIGAGGAVGKFGLVIFDDSPARRRILPEVLAPAVLNEVISDRTDGLFTIN